MPKLTVDAADIKPEKYIIWDSELKGFGLVVYATGVKSYVYQYRSPEGVKRRYTICRIGELTPDQARKKAEQLRHTVREGSDPLHEKQTLRHAETVGDLLDRYLASQDFADKAPSTQAINRGRIERHLRPLFGRRHAHLVTDGRQACTCRHS